MKLQIFDSSGTELKINDLVKIQHVRNGTLTFFARVQIINGQIFPCSKFSYDRIIKVNSVPEGCNHAPAKDDMPEYWMHPKTELHLIEENMLEKWRWDNLTFNRNKFYRVTA